MLDNRRKKKKRTKSSDNFRVSVPNTTSCRNLNELIYFSVLISSLFFLFSFFWLTERRAGSRGINS